MMPGGFWRWEYDGSNDRRASTLHQWEHGTVTTAQRFRSRAWKAVRVSAKVIAVGAIAFVAGAAVAAGPDSAIANAQLRGQLGRLESTLQAREGELALARLEMKRLQAIVRYSDKYDIPADLAAAIYDAARAEGIDPALAFSLVRVESEFRSRAVSSMGAVGLTQVMPSTAQILQPGIERAQLFDRDTNLRLGFRYLNEMLRQYKGDLRLALLAYNRGPGRVDEILRGGGDPSNGYASKVLGRQSE
ncbi:MAG: lytic transglycosylase domain-containing protein [Candidatus Cloacimonetes bacterium]|nr:lytic transglycosylase domain-containing protein [Candidatus Cloacimonadota bacterium]